MMGRAFFVTGTDTEVGKTVVSVLLIGALRRAGYSVLGMKPVASGCLPSEDGLRSEDAEALRDAASFAVDRALMNPYTFEPAISPHLAARDAGVEIDLVHIAGQLARLRQQADMVVVEGAGGWYAPLTDRHAMADLALTLQLPVVLVVGMRLGCLNHAILTAEAIRARGLPLAGWVANRLTASMDRFDDNLATLSDRLDAPCLGVIPCLDSVQDPADVLDGLDLDPLFAN